MYCKNCGAQIDDKAVICVHCGHQTTPPKKAASPAATILLLIFFFPVGLYLMWAKTNWSKVAKIIVTVIIAIIAVVALAGGGEETPQGGSNNPPSSQSQNTTNGSQQDTTAGTTTPVDPYANAVVITAEDLFAAYDTNEVAADNKYKGKELKITGTIKDIGKDILDDTYITLDTGNLIYSVQCYFKNSQLDAVAELAKNQTVTLVGKCDGQSMNVILKNCVIIEE